MAGPQIHNLGFTSILRKPGEPVFIDQGSDAVVVEGIIPSDTSMSILDPQR
jgi:hypothetical protein